MTGPVSQLPGIGLPAGAPDRSADPPAYPAVHDMPPARTSPTLTGLEQKEMEDDLVAAHDEQMKLVGRKPEAKDVKKTGSLKPQNNAKNEASIDPKNHRTEPMYLPPQPAPAAKPAATGIY